MGKERHKNSHRDRWCEELSRDDVHYAVRDKEEDDNVMMLPRSISF